MTMPSVKIKNKKKSKTSFLGYLLHLLKQKREFISEYFISAKIKIKKNARSNFHNEFQESNPILTF
jgi:hypothetical protein